MRKVAVFLLVLITSPLAFAQKDYDEVLRKNAHAIRILEEKVRMMEANQRFQIENLQKQLFLLSIQDTVQQKQMLSTMQFYLEQANKKYVEEITELKKIKEERKNEVGQLVQSYTTNIQGQINQQGSMLLFGGLSIVALCIMLFLVATKFIKDQQERYLNEFAHKQQSDLRAIIYSSFQDYLDRELQKFFHQNNPNNTQNSKEKDEWIALMQQKIFDLEAKLKEQQEQTTEKQEVEKTIVEVASKSLAQPNKVNKEPENTAKDSITMELLSEEHKPISEIDAKPIEVLAETPTQKEEIETENKKQTLPIEIEEENVTSVEEHNFVSNREWIEAIEQKINQSLKTSAEEEEIEEQVIYAKEETTDTFESEVYSPQYEEAMAKAMSYYEQRMLDEAIEFYGKAIALHPDYLAYTKRANCYHILKKYDQAAADYEKAIRIKKDFIPAYNNAIEIYILTDNFFQALTLLERLSQIEKSYSHKAVELYLRLIAQKGLMQNTEKTEKELDALLRENFTFNFSVKEIEDWLMTADIEATDKKMIRVKTELLKMKREYATFA